MNPRTFILRDNGIRLRAHEFVGELPVDARHPLEVIVRKHVPRRTLAENAKYWLWMGTIGNCLGYTKDEMDEVFRKMFLPATEIVAGGNTYYVHPSTKQLSLTSMADYMDHIERWAAENGIAI